jgi:hypothetical protein
MKIEKWVNVAQLRLPYVHPSKWEIRAMPEIFDTKEEAESKYYMGASYLEYLGACKIELEIPNFINK